MESCNKASIMSFKALSLIILVASNNFESMLHINAISVWMAVVIMGVLDEEAAAIEDDVDEEELFVESDVWGDEDEGPGGSSELLKCFNWPLEPIYIIKNSFL